MPRGNKGVRDGAVVAAPLTATLTERLPVLTSPFYDTAGRAFVERLIDACAWQLACDYHMAAPEDWVW